MNVSVLPVLFRDVQMQQVFRDGKTFVDCLPRMPEENIESTYLQLKDQPGFSLSSFVHDHFELPVPHTDYHQSDPGKSVKENIEILWQVLKREPGEKNGSLISLPYPYIVPGGRFGEVYYWDSYFTMLGLKVSGQHTLIEQMIRNFAWLIDTIGYIPNGNRKYYLGRSQPPFFSLMLQLLSDIKGISVYAQYLPQLETEYRFWMTGSDKLSESHPALHRVVRMPDGEILNRYWDENDSPRPESFREDVELAASGSRPAAAVYRHLRAGAESGWDFSSRWFSDEIHFHSIHTTDIIPIDLNLLLYQLELKLSAACEASDQQLAAQYQIRAEKRKAAIRKYCWNSSAGFYTDFDFLSGKQKKNPTLAGSSALFFGVASQEEAASMQRVLQENFLRPGGLITTLRETGQQWDAPNGWAPLQWLSVVGLENYGYHELARIIAERWIRLTESVFARTGKFMEKYNVVDISLEAGGGEYEGQDGFGWTNGVYLALCERFKKLSS